MKVQSLKRCSADWDPKQVTAAIVTCGGLCPGLNDVIQNIVFTLEDYGVRSDAVRLQRLLQCTSKTLHALQALSLHVMPFFLIGR